jgi:homopolymeric O-antigen transport system permease protein
MNQAPTESEILAGSFRKREALPNRGERRVFASKRQTSSLRYYLDLTWHLTQRDFILRYKGSVLGILWVIVIPLMQLMTLVFVFRSVVPLNIDSYPAFVFTALLPWTWFSNCLGTSGTLFTGNRDLIRKANFPPLILILVNTLSNLLLYLAVLPLVFVTLLIYGHHLAWTLCFLPVLLLFQIMLITGFSMMIASWNVLYRDVQQIVGVLLTLLFWITPVFYKSHAVDQRYQFVFDGNPLTGLIKSYRDIMFYSSPPEWQPFLFSASASIIIGILGYAVYRHKLHDVIDSL